MATRTDLGKIFMTNGGEYDPEVTYEKMTFVLYRNSTFLALQTVRGIEPSNDLVNWQYMARGFADEDFVAEKYVFVDRDEDSEFVDEPLIDADALGGQKPDFYAPQHEISDKFSEEKTYAVGDYTIHQNSLYRFTSSHSPGPFDGTEVVPVTVAGELQGVRGDFDKCKNYNFSNPSYTKDTITDMVEYYWPEMEDNRYGLVEYRNYSNSWIGVYKKTSNTSGTITINALNESYPSLKGVLSSTWSWKKLVASATSNAFFETAIGDIVHGMNGIYVGRFDNAMVGGGKYCIYLIATRSNTTMAYAFPITSYSDHKIYLNRMNAEGVWDSPEWIEIS